MHQTQTRRLANSVFRAPLVLCAAAIAAVLAAAGPVALPAAGAASAPTCVAEAAMPSRVALGARPVVLQVTLRGSSACRGVTTDNGGSATLDGPGGSSSNYPLRWARLGARDTVHFQLGLTKLGTYRISGGDLQTYDAEYMHIRYTWRSTSTSVKYVGRFAGISRSGGAVRATLQYYTNSGWHSHSGVGVELQRRSSNSWHAIAHMRSSSAGRVSFRAGSGQYRLVSASSTYVWTANHLVGSAAGA
jgi:hypothetical protein